MKIHEEIGRRALLPRLVVGFSAKPWCPFETDDGDEAIMFGDDAGDDGTGTKSSRVTGYRWFMNSHFI